MVKTLRRRRLLRLPTGSSSTPSRMRFRTWGGACCPPARGVALTKDSILEDGESDGLDP